LEQFHERVLAQALSVCVSHDPASEKREPQTLRVLDIPLFLGEVKEVVSKKFCL
jgi:hypothetical protein